MEDIARTIIEKTNNDDERKSLLLSALADRYGTKKDNEYAMNSLGELYSKVKTSKPHSKEWYDAMNNYDEASKIYRIVIGDDGIDYYDAEIEKERIRPNANEEKLEDMSIDTYTKDLNDFMDKNKKGRDDIPVTTRR